MIRWYLRWRQQKQQQKQQSCQQSTTKFSFYFASTTGHLFYYFIDLCISLLTDSHPDAAFTFFCIFQFSSRQKWMHESDPMLERQKEKMCTFIWLNILQTAGIKFLHLPFHLFSATAAAWIFECWRRRRLSVCVMAFWIHQCILFSLYTDTFADTVQQWTSEQWQQMGARWIVRLCLCHWQCRPVCLLLRLGASVLLQSFCWVQSEMEIANLNGAPMCGSS